MLFQAKRLLLDTVKINYVVQKKTDMIYMF